jgi:hypothetical protein
MDLPTYITNQNQENFNEELNQTLRDNLSNNGWIFPSLTTAQIIAIEPQMPNGTFWFNTTLAKGQLKTAPGVIETITSM